MWKIKLSKLDIRYQKKTAVRTFFSKSRKKWQNFLTLRWGTYNVAKACKNPMSMFRADNLHPLSLCPCILVSLCPCVCLNKNQHAECYQRHSKKVKIVWEERDPTNALFLKLKTEKLTNFQNLCILSGKHENKCVGCPGTCHIFNVVR